MSKHKHKTNDKRRSQYHHCDVSQMGILCKNKKLITLKMTSWPVVFHADSATKKK
jgi:hypothetical protein